MMQTTRKSYGLLVLTMLCLNMYLLKGQTDSLNKFSFLIGDFIFEGKTLNSSNTYSKYEGTWSGDYALNGNVIIEEFKINGPEGKPVFHGMTTRAFNNKENRWVMGFFDALNPAWYPLGNPSFKDDGSITFFGRFPGMKEGQKLRITFYDISQDSFKWKSDLSMDNGATWTENYTIIEALKKQS